ncbi:heterokaryon incompatibility protein-domain-containing protein [Cercophora samala]|uniref:Heterokaryon incompatibility protein-domain-containing protein n=1 Tax=Cercophora samala TaxID=330535 RepID=A0AA39ZBL5_9PEZI|nr:heterokaryon incompatibility protein-domain-containing protein [Cercophora samala]
MPINLISVSSPDKIPPRRPLQSHISNSIAMIKKWTSQCVDEHGLRCSRGTPAKLPTRLLKVTGEKIRLVDSRDITLSEGQPLPAYLTLSHSWGPNSHTQIKATSTNIWVLRRGLSFRQLSKTFQDAVMVTRELGFGYIWIDSLCIIQDDRHDWDRESSMMASIYQNSFLTLSATRCADGHGGFFSPFSNTPYVWRGAKTNVVKNKHLWDLKKIESGSVQRWFALTPPDDIRDIPLHNISSSNVEVHLSHPLLTRARAFQERLLSPRVVHFGNTQLAWECRGSFWTDDYIVEDDPSKRQNDLPAYLSPEQSLFWKQQIEDSPANLHKGLPVVMYPIEETRLRFISLITTPSTEKSEPDTARQTWNVIVEAFSHLMLAYEMDRLPALSGIALAMKPFVSTSSSETKYLGGIWSSQIPQAFYWACTSRFAARPTSYRAPSFSWASIEGPIAFRNPWKARGLFQTRETPTATSSCELLECSSQAEGVDVHGRVTGGYVKLRSWVSWGRIRETGDTWVIEHMPGLQRQKFWPDTPQYTTPTKKGDEVRLCLLECMELSNDPLRGVINPGSWYRVMVLVLRPSLTTKGAWERFGLIYPAEDLDSYLNRREDAGADIGTDTSMFADPFSWFRTQEVLEIV